MHFDNPLIDKDPLGARSGVDFNRVVGAIHRVDDEAVGEIGAAMK